MAGGTLAAGKEIKRLAPRAKNIDQKRNAGKPITKEEEGGLALAPVITNIKAREASQAVIGEGNKNNKRTGFQTNRHPYKMTKDGKYGKLTIDVPQLVEKHRLLAKKRGWCFLMKKLILILLILLVKDMIQKKNTLIYQTLYSKH